MREVLMMLRLNCLPFHTRFKLFNLLLLLLLLTIVCALIGQFLRKGYGSTGGTRRHKRSIKSLQLSDEERNFKITCRFHSCFEINDCSITIHDRIGVYVYPEFEYVDNGLQQSYTSVLSTEYTEILEAIRNSPYYQPNASRACVFVPAVDTLNENRMDVRLVSSLLDSQPGWNKGQNHLVFSMLSGSHPDYNSTPDFYYGKAMVAGGSFSQPSYRLGFDISVPVYNPLTHSDGYLITSHTAERPIFLSVLGHGSVPEGLAQPGQGHSMYDDGAVLLLELCPLAKVSHDLQPWKRCRSGSGDVVDYPDVLERSKFCLLLPWIRYGTPDLMDILMTGCIPVLIGDEHVLPFSEVIDWTRISVRVWSMEMGGVMKRLREYSDTLISETREQVLFLYERFFSSMAAITITTLNILNERVFPTSSRGYEWWNNQEYDVGITDKFQYGRPQGISLPTPPSSEGFTAVILTFDRVKMLFEVIESVARAPSLSKVLVIWNNINLSPPPAEEWPRIRKPIQIIRSKQNRLSNRFHPYTEIGTAAILALDDDITMLTADELEFGYKAWQEFPDRLVGFPGRVHVFDYDKQQWKYESNWLNNISMVLTGAAFYHKYYHHLYTHVMPREIKEWVDRHFNCEDIAMNFLIANFTGQPPLKVSPRKKFKCPACTSEESLWSDPQHYQERDECINVFDKFFKGLPLQSVKFRLDPVLYKDPIEDSLKAFPNMGEL